MTTPTVAQAPLLGQHDLRNIRVAAARVLAMSVAAPYLRRDLSRAELQLLALAGVICEIIKGQFGEDADGEPIGDLELRAQPYVPAAYRPKLRLGENGD